MASRFWVGGTGNWSDTAHWAAASGGAGGQTVPTNADDVFLDGSSGSGIITNDINTNLCRNFDATGYIGTLAMTQTLTTNPTAGGTVTLGAGMTITGGAAFVISSASGANATLTTNGKSLPNVTISASTTGGVTVADAWTVTHAVTLTQGTLNTNGKACQWESFSSSNSNTRTLTLGASAITLTGTGNVFLITTTTGITITANTAVITSNGATATINVANGFSLNGASVIMAGSGTASLANTLTLGTGNFTRTGTAAKTDMLQLFGGISCGVFTCNGDSATNRVLIFSNTIGTARTITASTVSVSNADFQDITGAGAGNWNLSGLTGNSGDCGGNTGITFTTSALQTWQTTTSGNWSDVTKWTSRVPLPQDDVAVASAFSASQTITADMPRAGRSIDFTGSTGTPTWTPSASPTLYGSLTLISGMTMGSGGVTFAGRTACTVTCATRSIAGDVNVLMFNGTLTLQDTFGMISTSTLRMQSGTLNANNQSVNIGRFTINNGTLNMGTGIWTLNRNDAGTSAGGNPWNASGGVINASTSTIVLADTLQDKTFAGGGFTYGTLRYITTGSAALIITGNNTFANLDIECTTARTITLPASGTQTITGTLTLKGASGQVLSLVSSSPGTATTLSLTGTAVMNQFVTLSADISLNARWWVGGSGTWDGATTTNWSLTSGGAGGASVPTSSTQVLVDANSGSGTITVAAGNAGSNLDFTGYTGTFSFGSTSSLTLTPTSIVRFVSGMTIAGTVSLNINPAAGVSVALTTGGKTLPGLSLGGNATSTVILQDALTVSGTLLLAQGIFNTNSQTCTWGTFSSSNANTRTLTLGASAVTITAVVSNMWLSSPTNLTITANTATITFTATNSPGSSFTVMNTGGAQNFNGASILFVGGGSPILNGPVTCANFTRTGTALKTDTLNILGGLTCTGTFTANGNSSINRLLIQANVIGTAITITAATVSITNSDFQDITGAGAGNWNLSAITGGSGDCLGNSGITFTTPATQTWQTTTNGSWSDVTKWTSRVPLPQDDVVINKVFSASQTITADMPRLGRSIDFTGTTGNPTLTTSTNTQSFGSLILVAGMTGPQGNTWTFSGRGSYVLDTLGAFGGSIVISAFGGTYTLASTLTIGPLLDFRVDGGSFVTNNFNLTCGKLRTDATANVRSITLGTSTITCAASSAGTLFNCGSGLGTLTVSAASATIIFSDTGVNTKTFAGGGFTYGTFRFVSAGSGALVITGNNTFANLDLECSTACTVTLPASGTQTINTSLAVNGILGQVLALVSSSPGTSTILKVNAPGTNTLTNYTRTADILFQFWTGGVIRSVSAIAASEQHTTFDVGTIRSKATPVGVDTRTAVDTGTIKSVGRIVAVDTTQFADAIAVRSANKLSIADIHALVDSGTITARSLFSTVEVPAHYEVGLIRSVSSITMLRLLPVVQLSGNLWRRWHGNHKAVR